MTRHLGPARLALAALLGTALVLPTACTTSANHRGERTTVRHYTFAETERSSRDVDSGSSGASRWYPVASPTGTNGVIAREPASVAPAQSQPTQPPSTDREPGSSLFKTPPTTTDQSPELPPYASTQIVPLTALHRRPSSHTVVIDAGHGGRDHGTSGNGIVEKRLVLSIAQALAALLRDAGFTVVMTRTTDAFPSLADRVATATRHRPILFVSVHVNQAANTNANGVEVFYRTDGARRIASRNQAAARFVARALSRATGAHRRGARRDARGLYVLKRAGYPAVLAELGFVSNRAEATKLKTADYQDRLARGLFNGVAAYFNDRYRID